VWTEVQAAAARYHDPGRFVALVGYEWTNWVYGHRHVVYFDAAGPLFSSLDERYDHPTELWTALREHRAMSIAHHSAGGPVAIDWSLPPDPVVEPVTEVVSVHGQSEAAGTPGVIYDSVAGNFVVDQLVHRGYRLGFLGSTDGHDGHPGLAQLVGPSGGLAAILSESVTRDGVYEALKRRSVYATNGSRIILRVHVDGVPMGAELEPRAEAEVALTVIGTAPIDRVELVRGGEVVGSRRGEGVALVHTWTLDSLVTDDFVYVRVLQSDGGMAWSSPVYITSN